MEDSRIIELFFERSEQAIVELSKKYGTLCRRTANNILNSEQDAEECVNDALLGVWNTIPPRNPGSLPGYLLRVVRNLALKKYHENTARKRNSFYDVALEEVEDCLPVSFDGDDEYAAKELACMIDGFLDGLDRESRILFVRRYWHAESIDSLAAAFGKSKHWVSVRLSRIRKALKQYLEKKGVTV